MTASAMVTVTDSDNSRKRFFFDSLIDAQVFRNAKEEHGYSARVSVI